jgi:hypothetical protein
MPGRAVALFKQYPFKIDQKISIAEDSVILSRNRPTGNGHNRAETAVRDCH